MVVLLKWTLHGLLMYERKLDLIHYGHLHAEQAIYNNNSKYTTVLWGKNREKN